MDDQNPKYDSYLQYQVDEFANKLMVASEQVDFAHRILNSTDDHLAVVGADGIITEVNEAWNRFARENEGDETRCGVGVCYFQECRDDWGDTTSCYEAYDGIQKVQNGTLSHFEIEYPCNSPTENRWFSMRVLPLVGRSGTVLVYHTNITDRKKIEDELVNTKNLLEHQVHLLQRALIPAKPEIIEGYSVASAYIPAHEGTEIGGDFMDVFRTEDGKVGILIGDVSGKGIESAALAAITRSTVRAFAYDLSSPNEALTHANSLLSAQQVDYMQFVTAFLVVLDPATGDIICSNAGHPPAILSRGNGDTELLCIYNMPLGIQGSIKYEECYSNLKPGDKLILYTDGITEARHDHDFFGMEGIIHVLTSCSQSAPDAMVDKILETVKNWAHGELRDDTAILIIGRDA
ncbi:MAG: SpoIIE family protein phosphatase [Armatimonadota bacterium]